jgi:regulator of sigma E protease
MTLSTGISILLAILSLSLLVFIHELGHYLVARWVGMRVEVFSIGFGRAIWSRMRKGVKWQIGVLPFGGYVKIAGMEREKGSDPRKIKGGFYSKPPLARIAVAFAGPLINIIFAFAAFTLLWSIGGRVTPFYAHTQYIGYVAPDSPLYNEGVRPGDRLTTLQGEPYTGFQDLIYTSMVKNATSISVEGERIDYLKGRKSPFSYTLTGEAPHIRELGIGGAAQYLIYAKRAGSRENSLYPGAPMFESGIQYGDRFVWVDGELVFSHHQLMRLVNDQKTLLTVRRGSELLLIKVPRVAIDDMRLSSSERGEFDDWMHALAMPGKIDDKIFIPYQVNRDLIVEHPFPFIDDDAEPRLYGDDAPLRRGDRIIAVDGKPLTSLYDLFSDLQEKHVSIIVERGHPPAPIPWNERDDSFENETKWSEIVPLIASFGLPGAEMENGSFARLERVTPVRYGDFPLPSHKKAYIDQKYQSDREEIAAIEDPKEREQAEALLESTHSRLMLGITLSDRQLIYNPNPWQLTRSVLSDMHRTLSSIFSGSVSPKHLAGPIGIVSIAQQSWLDQGYRQGIYFLAFISLNLALLNLLPLPVLDGGHIVVSCIEAIRKKPVSAELLERLTVLFVFLLLAFFVYITYHDIVRLIERLF